MLSAFYRIKLRVPKAEYKSHGLLLVLLETLLLLAVLHIYIPSDNELVACVDRKQNYGTPLLRTWYDAKKRIIL